MDERGDKGGRGETGFQRDSQAIDSTLLLLRKTMNMISGLGR